MSKSKKSNDSIDTCENYELTKTLILDSIQNVFTCLIEALRNGDQLAINIKSRCDKNGLYIKCLSIIHNLVQNDLYATKRDLYYQYKDLFENPIALYNMIDDWATTFDVPRSSLHILSSNKGLVAGHLELVDVDGNLIDCMKTNAGITIPHHVEVLQSIKTSAKFVLIIEKDSTFQRLLDAKFLDTVEAILVTGKGMPDLSTRQLVHTIWTQFQIPSFCLIDANPFGIQIMSIYKYGSVSLSHDNANLIVPNLKFLGIDIKDLEIAKIKANHFLPLSEEDKAKATSLLTKSFIINEPQWKEQLEFMLEKNYKAEIQCLQSISNNFLTFYIRTKLIKHLNNI